MNLVYVVWLIGGMLLGSMHAAALWRISKQPEKLRPWRGVARLLGVAIVLAVSAVMGGILPLFVGWVIGFLANVGFVLYGRTR